jgi:aspartate/methionine/tyrosine aminotransferase
VHEDEAVDILARQYGVLLMPGSPFGAPQYMRMSYGGLPPGMYYIFIYINIYMYI